MWQHWSAITSLSTEMRVNGNVKVNMAALNVLAPVIEWLGSQRGKEKLIIDGYSFTNKGKGKAER